MLANPACLIGWSASGISIVDPVAGITRDRVLRRFEIAGRAFDLLIPAGDGRVVDKDGLTDEVEHQIKQGVDQADLLLFVVDADRRPGCVRRTILQRIAQKPAGQSSASSTSAITSGWNEMPPLSLPGLAFLSSTSAPITTTVATKSSRRFSKTLPEDQFAHSRGRADPSTLTRS